MTPLDLLKKLAEEISVAVENFQLIAQYQPSRPVSVYIQNVPTVKFKSDSYYPLIVVELLSLEDDVEYSTANVLLTFGTYDGEREDAVTDHINLVTAVRKYLLENRIIGDLYSLQLPLYLGMVEKTSENFTFSNMFATYQVAHSYPSFVSGWDKPLKL